MPLWQALLPVNRFVSASLPLDAADVRHDHEAQASHAGNADDVGEGDSAAPARLRQRRGGRQRAGNVGASASTHGDGQDTRCVGSCRADASLALQLYRGLQGEMSEIMLLAWELQGALFTAPCRVFPPC